MADGITKKDIDDTLRAVGVDHDVDEVAPAASRASDIDDTLRAIGIEPGSFKDTAAERAALRARRAVRRTTPAMGPGFPEPEPPPETKALAERRGLIAQGVSAMPVVGPLMDRAAAAGGAMLQDEPNTTFGERYGRNLQMEQQADRWYRSQNPLSSLAAGTVGAVGGTAPFAATRLGGMLMGTYGPSLGSRVATGAIGGAGIGAADAALRGDNPIHGAMFGGAGGIAGPLVGEAARGGTNLVSQYLWPRTGALRGMNSEAVNKLTGAFEGETTASLAAGRERMGPAGFMSDVNQGTTDIAGWLADTPGPHKAVVREAYRVRDAAARGRIEQAATDAAGPPVNLKTFEKMTTEGRKLAADPLYQQFRDTTIPPTDKLQALLPRLRAAGALDEANKLAGITGESVNMKFLEPDGGKLAAPTAQTWDYAKRGLDMKIEAAYAAGNKTMARALVGLKNELLDEIGNSPGGDVYNAARKAFAEHSALLDQVAAGRDTFLGGRTGISADELREELRGLSRPELTARLIGMRAAIKDTMGSAFNGDTTMRNKFLAPNNQDKLALLVGQDKADKLVQSMRQEKFLKTQSENIVGGTQTTPKKERVLAHEQQPMPEYNPNLTEPLSLLPPRLREELRPTSILEAWRGQRHGETKNQLARLITTPEGPQLDELIAALSREAQRQSRVGAVGGRVGNVLTGAVTGPVSTMARRGQADERRRAP